MYIGLQKFCSQTHHTHTHTHTHTDHLVFSFLLFTFTKIFFILKWWLDLFVPVLSFSLSVCLPVFLSLFISLTHTHTDHLVYSFCYPFSQLFFTLKWWLNFSVPVLSLSNTQTHTPTHTHPDWLRPNRNSDRTVCVRLTLIHFLVWSLIHFPMLIVHVCACVNYYNNFVYMFLFF